MPDPALNAAEEGAAHLYCHDNELVSLRKEITRLERSELDHGFYRCDG
jgi:hypothetical protein